MKLSKECLKRAGRTFMQAVLAYITVNVVLIDFTDEKSAVKSAVVGLLTASLAAGIAAVMNLSKGECSDDNG